MTDCRPAKKGVWGVNLQEAFSSRYKVCCVLTTRFVDFGDHCGQKPAKHTSTNSFHIKVLHSASTFVCAVGTTNASDSRGSH